VKPATAFRGEKATQAISLIGVQAVLMMLLHTAPQPYRIPGLIDFHF
jgi:hypothetical protein